MASLGHTVSVRFAVRYPIGAPFRIWLGSKIVAFGLWLASSDIRLIPEGEA